MTDCWLRVGVVSRMRTGIRRGLSLFAIYAIALHTVLWGAVVPAATATIDPFTVICHSDASTTPAEQAPNNSRLIPAHACDHCNLCSAAPAPTPSAALAIDFRPPRLVPMVFSAPSIARADVTSEPKLARGPPRQA